MNERRLRILLADDDEMSRTVFARILGEFTGFDIVECSGGLEARDRFEESPFPLVISDVRMPGLDGLELLQFIRSHPEGRSTKVILITGFADLRMALLALREGATDLLTKPIPVTDLLQVVERATLAWRREQQPASRATLTDSSFVDDGLDPDRPVRSTFELPGNERIGVFSRPMRALVESALRYHRDRGIPVLIEGETGTGKEMMAKAVHFGGNQDDGHPFVTVNCAAISPSLFESELFGYVGGAFTGALPKGAKGKLEVANGGTLFLDEVGEIPLPMQAKLLRALQDHAIYRVGSTDRIALDVRIIAATNRDLEALVDRGEFRSDLFYRLAVGRMRVPPLREQRSAVPALAQLFLAELAAAKQRDFRFISRDAVAMLEQYDWPGNIRQLRNQIEHAVLLHNAVELDAHHLAQLKARMHGDEAGGLSVLQPGGFRLPDDRLDLDELTRDIVRRALAKFDGNQSRTADYLGLSRGRLRTLLSHLDES